MDLCDAATAWAGRSRHDVRYRGGLVDRHQRQVLADVAGTHDVDAHPVVLDDTFFHVAGDCDERGDEGRRAEIDQLLGGADCDGEHTGQNVVGLGDEDDCRVRRAAYKSRCVHDCDDCPQDHPWLVEALEGSHCGHGEPQAGPGRVDVGVGRTEVQAATKDEDDEAVVMSKAHMGRCDSMKATFTTTT